MHRTSDKYQLVKPEEAKRLLSAIEKQLAHRFQEIRDEKYNPNTKGYDYEEILKKFFENYLGGAFDFYIRLGVLDVELKINSMLEPRKNEFDVIAVYKNAVPKVIHLRFIPYDSVAFITEAAQTLTLQKLKADLKKLERLNCLQIGRRNICHSSRTLMFPINRPLRMLFYYESKANADAVEQLLLHERKGVWDILVIMNSHFVIYNTTLPLVTKVWKYSSPTVDLEYPLLKAMFLTCASIEGDFIDSWLIFWNLFRSVA
jgi:hypothetical protein